MIAGLRGLLLTSEHKPLTEVNLQPPRHRFVKLRQAKPGERE
jgi:hypothetical protein